MQIGYDAMDRQVQIVGWDGKIKNRVYDLAGRIVTVIDDVGGFARVQDMAYDRLNQLTRVVLNDSDGPAQETMYGYDSAGRPISAVASDGATTGYEYDGVGRLTKTNDPRGFAIDFGYDGRGLMTSRTVDDVGFEAFHVNETFSYDGAGRVIVSQRDANNRAALQYRSEERRVGKECRSRWSPDH